MKFEYVARSITHTFTLHITLSSFLTLPISFTLLGLTKKKENYLTEFYWQWEETLKKVMAAVIRQLPSSANSSPNFPRIQKLPEFRSSRAHFFWFVTFVSFNYFCRMIKKKTRHVFSQSWKNVHANDATTYIKYIKI